MTASDLHACPLCGGAGISPYHRDSARDYLACRDCHLVFVPTALHLSAADEKACERRKKSLHVLLAKARALPPEKQIRLINRYVNKRRYRRDRTTKLVTDLSDEPLKYRSRWSTVGEFLRRGGDCEDYATTKYFLLRELGFPSERLRVVVTFDRRARAHHAVLAVAWQNNEVWLLETDNSIKTRSHSGYRYIYAMNENSIWDHEESTERSAGGH